MQGENGQEFVKMLEDTSPQIQQNGTNLGEERTQLDTLCPHLVKTKGGGNIVQASGALPTQERRQGFVGDSCSEWARSVPGRAGVLRAPLPTVPPWGPGCAW